MIKRLRVKFILINMLSVFLVLAAVFGVLLYVSSKRLIESSNAALSMALSREYDSDEMPWEIGGGSKLQNNPGEGGLRLNDSFFVLTFTVAVDTDGAILSTYGATVDINDDILNSAVAAALSDPDGSGTIADLHLRYLVNFAPYSVKIAFADTSADRIIMNNLILTSLQVGIPALLIFFLLAYFLSGLALKPAKAAWQQQQRFVADASHELKTPLTVILANTDILLAHPDETIQSRRKWIDNTKTEGERMKKLTDNLMFLAKSDAAEHMKTNPTPHEQVNLSDTAWNALLPFESVAFEQKIELSSDIKPDVTVSGNAEQLNRLIVILIDNACKYGGPNAKIALSLTKEQGRAKLSVHNTGNPIDKGDIPHIFDRFYRADKSRTQIGDLTDLRQKTNVNAADQSHAQTGGGYGLGLSIAKSIVDAHGGKLTVISNAEDGTTFSAEFPSK